MIHGNLLVMALVLFLRGVNVGGHKTFKPSELAKALAHLDVVNIGAAGTFVIRGNISQGALRAEVLRRLPFEPELMVCKVKEVVDLVASNPFAGAASAKVRAHYVTIMAKPLKKAAPLPIEAPVGKPWQVKIIAVSGRFVMSQHRGEGNRLIYPNEVVEKLFKVPATTRNWNTITEVTALL